MSVSNEANAAYSKYKDVHHRFESGDMSVSESDVSRAYGEYMSAHNEHDALEGYRHYEPYFLGMSRRRDDRSSSLLDDCFDDTPTIQWRSPPSRGRVRAAPGEGRKMWTKARWARELRNVLIFMGIMLGMGGTCFVCVKVDQNEPWAMLVFGAFVVILFINLILIGMYPTGKR